MADSFSEDGFFGETQELRVRGEGKGENDRLGGGEAPEAPMR